MKARFSAVAVVFGSTADRYVLKGYTPARSLDQMLDDAAQVPGLTGIELVGGWHLNDANQESVVKSIADHGFEISMLIPELWADSKWGWEPSPRRTRSSGRRRRTGSASPWTSRAGWAATR